MDGQDELAYLYFGEIDTHSPRSQHTRYEPVQKQGEELFSGALTICGSGHLLEDITQQGTALRTSAALAL